MKFKLFDYPSGILLKSSTLIVHISQDGKEREILEFSTEPKKRCRLNFGWCTKAWFPQDQK